MDGLTDPKIRQSVIDELLKYLDTDTTWYVDRIDSCCGGLLPSPREPFALPSHLLPTLIPLPLHILLSSSSLHSFPSDSPSPLVRLQETHWKPLHAHFKQTHGLDIKSFDGLVIGGKFRQDERTRSYLREVVEKWDEWEVAGE